MESKKNKEKQIAAAKIEQVLGKAMVDIKFQEKLFKDPEKVGKELGLNESGIELIKSLDKKSFESFIKKLDAKLLIEAATVSFCA